MVVYYKVAGQSIGSHWLSIATLSTMFIGSWAMTGGKKATDSKGPPINASSKDEEDFVQQFIANQEKEENKGSPKAREGGAH